MDGPRSLDLSASEALVLAPACILAEALALHQQSLSVNGHLHRSGSVMLA